MTRRIPSSRNEPDRASDAHAFFRGASAPEGSSATKLFKRESNARRAETRAGRVRRMRPGRSGVHDRPRVSPHFTSLSREVAVRSRPASARAPERCEHNERDQIGCHLHDIGAHRQAVLCMRSRRLPPRQRRQAIAAPKGFQRAINEASEIAATAGHAVGEGPTYCKRELRRQCQRCLQATTEHTHAKRLGPEAKSTPGLPVARSVKPACVRPRKNARATQPRLQIVNGGSANRIGPTTGMSARPESWQAGSGVDEWRWRLPPGGRA